MSETPDEYRVAPIWKNAYACGCVAEPGINYDPQGVLSIHLTLIRQWRNESLTLRRIGEANAGFASGEREIAEAETLWACANELEKVLGLGA